jgi:hypothetical protein
VGAPGHGEVVEVAFWEGKERKRKTNKKERRREMKPQQGILKRASESVGRRAGGVQSGHERGQQAEQAKRRVPEGA